MIVIGLKGLSIMANEYESIILDDEKFQELMTKYRNAASDVAKILLSSDSDSNGELTENELAVGLLDLILQLANSSTSEADPEEPTYETPSGYSFTGIRKGSQKLDLTRITNKLKDINTAIVANLTKNNLIAFFNISISNSSSAPMHNNIIEDKGSVKKDIIIL